MMKNKRLPKFSLITFLILLFAFAACKQQPNNNQTPYTISRERVVGKGGGGLVARLTSPPKTFNFLLAGDEASLTVSLFLISSRLIELDHDTQLYIGGL